MIVPKDEYCFECEQYHPRWLDGCLNLQKIITMKKHGGKRLNAGRKPKYNEPTKTVSFRIPISKETIIRETILNLLSS